MFSFLSLAIAHLHPHTEGDSTMHLEIELAQVPWGADYNLHLRYADLYTVLCSMILRRQPDTVVLTAQRCTSNVRNLGAGG